MTGPLTAWGAVTDVAPLAGGHRSTLFRARIAGLDCVARKADVSEASARWLMALHRRAAQVGLNPPALISSRNGALVCCGWTVELHMPGTPGQSLDLAAIAGRIRALHRMTRQFPARPRRPTTRLPHNHSIALSGLSAASPVAAIHGDLHPGNLIRRADGSLTLLDWEEARVGPVELDLSALRQDLTPLRLANEVAQGWRAEPGHARSCARALRRRIGHIRAR